MTTHELISTPIHHRDDRDLHVAPVQSVFGGERTTSLERDYHAAFTCSLGLWLLMMSCLLGQLS